MAIIITDQYRLRQKNYLDDRQGLASSTTALKNWDFSTVPIPEGFEVCVSGIWYVYNSGNTSDTTLGYFRKRTDKEGVGNLETRVSAVETKELKLDFDDKLDTVSKFSTLLTESFWKDSTGENHVRAGRIVTVTGDTADKNGPWYLTNSNYSQAASWIKLISRGDLIKTTDSTTPSDTNLYTAANTDKIFPKKAGTETISGSWTFTNNSTFTKNLNVTGKTTTGSLEVSQDTKLDGNAEVLGNLTADANLTVKNKLSVEKELDISGRGSIKKDQTTGRVVATFDKIVAEVGELGNLDEEITKKMGLIGVNNLLMNTSFRGQYDTMVVDSETNLYNVDDLYSSRRENWKVTTADWIIVEDVGSVTGYSVKLITNLSSFSQLTSSSLIGGEKYTLSWKQKGTITVTLDGETLETVELSSDPTTGYHRYYAQYIPNTNKQVTFKATGGLGYICEIKLEEGIVPTTWFPSVNDTDPVASKFRDYEFLKTAFEEYEGDGLVSSIFLKTQLKIGDYQNGDIGQICGGISGVTNDDQDVLFWFGSTYETALDLLTNIIINPNYLDTLTLDQLKTLTKVIITKNTKTILTDVYAAGKFRGNFSGMFEGGYLKGLYAKIPYYTGTQSSNLIFSGGVLVNSNGDPITTDIISKNPGDTTQTITLKFNKGLYTAAITSGRFLTANYVFSGLSSPEPSKFYLSFTKEGYLAIVSEEDKIDSYYWY